MIYKINLYIVIKITPINSYLFLIDLYYALL